MTKIKVEGVVYNVDGFIKMFTITDKENVRKAKCMPKSYPEKLLTPLIPEGVGTFKGDNMPEQWSVNKHFKVGEQYPIYFSEDEFVVSPVDGVGRKIVQQAWKVKVF